MSAPARSRPTVPCKGSAELGVEQIEILMQPGQDTPHDLEVVVGQYNFRRPELRHRQDRLDLADDHQQRHPIVGRERVDQADQNFRFKDLV